LKLSILFEDSPGKKVLISGNEAFARGIYESGVTFAANYPGTPLSEIGDYLNFLSETNDKFTFDYSLNEKVALESAIGASWAGVRSVALFKHLGLNVAADPLHTFPYSGVNAGMLIICGGDPAILSSTNAQDNRLYALHTKIPILEPATVQECKDFIKEGLRISELYNIPIYIHVNTRLCHSYGIVSYSEVAVPNPIGKFEKDPDRYINTRGRALANQRKYFDTIAEIAKNKKLYHLMNKNKIIHKDSEISKTGILTSGVCYSYIIQACHKLQINPPILKLGLVFPINREEICHFADKYKLNKLLVIEELESFMETFSKSVFCNFCDTKQDLDVHGKDFLPNTGELNTDIIMKFFKRHFTIKSQNLLEEIEIKEKALNEILPDLPPREPTFCPGCPYRPVFYALKKTTEELENTLNLKFIFGGDIGCYTLSEAYPYELIDWVICMGAGIGISNGMGLNIDSTHQKLIAYVGDSTLFHTGLQPLLNAIKNNIDLTIIVFNNYWTAMTGHQEFIGTPNDLVTRNGNQSKTERYKLNPITFLKCLGIKNLTITRAYNINKLTRIFNSELLKPGTKVIIINDECALEKSRRKRREARDSEEQKHHEVYYTISDSCVKCNECIEYLGCPAINVKLPTSESLSNDALKRKELKYYIDETRCLPDICPGICKSVCKNNSIKKTIINPETDKKK